MAEKTAKKRKGETLGYTALTLAIIAFIVPIVWWSLVQAFAPNKVVYNTFNVGEIQLYNGTDRKNVIELRYYSNDKGNGLEMLDIKFNEYLDETKSMFYSQGIQFVADTKEDSLSDWTFSVKKVGLSIANGTWWGTYDNLPNGSIHTYASADDYATTLNDASELGTNPDFKIELAKVDGSGTDLYLMEMKGKNTVKSEENKVATTDYGLGGLNVYAYNDIYYLSYKLYQQVQGLANGTSQNLVFDFGEMFEFKNYEKGTYLDAQERETAKVDLRTQSNYVIKTQIFEDGARQASDSIFNNIKGSNSFTLDGDYVDEDYYIGRSQINIDNSFFEKIVIAGKSVALKLKDEFIEASKPYKANIELNITIDMDKLEDEGYTFLGFSSQSGLENYTIKKCVTIKTINGERIETEVET